jgi:hypothetical protein
MKFTEKKLTGNEPARCVDGRPAHESPQGPQMLGGSLHPITLNAIITDREFDESAVRKDLQILKESGFMLGVHRGHHKDEKQGKSDCGFADRIKEIIQASKDNKEEILKRLGNVYKLNGIDTNAVQSSYAFISNFTLEKIKITGEKLIRSSQESGAEIEDLEGDHQEQAAFVNLKPETTLDTQALNKSGKQAFNLDLWAAIQQGLVLIKNANVETLRDLSLILYQATEMVLVEQKGKSPLPAILHK